MYMLTVSSRCTSCIVMFLFTCMLECVLTLSVIMCVAVLQSVLVGGHAEDGRGIQHNGVSTGRRIDAAHSGREDQCTHWFAQQGMSFLGFVSLVCSLHWLCVRLIANCVQLPKHLHWDTFEDCCSAGFCRSSVPPNIQSNLSEHCRYHKSTNSCFLYHLACC